MDNIVLLSITAEDLRHLITTSVVEALGQQPPAPIAAPIPQPDDYLSRDDVKRMLRLSYPTLRNLEIRGELMPVRIARRVLYRRRDVEGALKGMPANSEFTRRGRARRG
jgi:hypothetical protein